MTDELPKISTHGIIDVWDGYDITDSRNGEPLDRRFIAAIALLIVTIEGRQG